MKWLFPVLLLLSLAGCGENPVRGQASDDKIAKVNLQLGIGYMNEGENKQAMSKLQKALRYDPDNPEIHNVLALLYSRLHENDKAAAHFRRAISLAPGEPRYHNNYGAFLCSQKKYDHANRLFQRVLADPVYVRKDQVHENMGLCAMQAGNIGLAQKHLEAALRMNHRLAKARLAMAQLRYDRGHFEAAYIEYKRFLEAGQHSAASLWLGALLERQRGNMAAAKAYAVKLKVKFPDSSEAQRLRTLEAQGRF